MQPQPGLLMVLTISLVLSLLQALSLQERQWPATPLTLHDLDDDTHQSPTKRQSCENTASDRSCWGDYSISTNYYDEVPDTGVTREYYFSVQDGTLAPDGVSRYAQTINGSIPGPTIIADWGDTVVVHVTNNLASSTNGTGIHFHGIRQNYTNQNDGVPSITQCPIPPGSSYTYTWRATQYGSSWYHSHFSLQAWEGVFGGIQINGPATANYDVDLGPLVLSDWSHQTVDELYTHAETVGPPTLDNGLINGTNVWDDGGSRFQQNVTSGTTYRFRLVNTAVDTHWKFAVDNHTLTVIAADFVPIVPFTTDVVSIGMGQRYDVLLTADQASSSYWMRAIPQSSCSENESVNNIRGIVSYSDAAVATPTTSASDAAQVIDCNDMPMASLVPYLSLDAGDFASAPSELAVTLGFNSASLFKWAFNSSTFLSSWSAPALSQIVANESAYSAAAYNGTIVLDTANVWFGLVIETTVDVAHPIHLHGHDFYILSQGTGSWNSSVSLLTTNPPRRDVVMLPADGYVVLAWKTDNPGVWLAHCHIGWHTEEGLALQFVERPAEIAALVDQTTLQATCDAWETWASAESVVQDDSGV